ncbi:MAG: hypothetical protein KDD62_00830 [Bdellovibrionales bacterium]|nr:hypothetical protein [Bdellovibrionales bacterium]
MDHDYEQDLRKLAYRVGVNFDAEQEDWDLLHTNEVTVSLFYEFACDLNCPNRLYFIHCLYLFAGDFIKDYASNLSELSIAEGSRGAVLFKLVAHAEACPDEIIKKWARRTRDLMADPSKYHYDDWASGGFAEEDDGVMKLRTEKVRRLGLNRVV